MTIVVGIAVIVAAIALGAAAQRAADRRRLHRAVAFLRGGAL